MIAPPPPIRVYEAEESFESRRAKLEQDSRMDAKSKQAILEFVDHLGASGLTTHRQPVKLPSIVPTTEPYTTMGAGFADKAFAARASARRPASPKASKRIMHPRPRARWSSSSADDPRLHALHLG